MAKPRIIERRMKEPEPVRFESLQAMARLSIGSGSARLPRGVAKKSLQCLTGDTLGRPAFVAQASEMVLCAGRRTAQPQEPAGGENAQRRQRQWRRPAQAAPQRPRRAARTLLDKSDDGHLS